MIQRFTPAEEIPSDAGERAWVGAAGDVAISPLSDGATSAVPNRRNGVVDRIPSH